MFPQIYCAVRFENAVLTGAAIDLPKCRTQPCGVVAWSVFGAISTSVLSGSVWCECCWRLVHVGFVSASAATSWFQYGVIAQGRCEFVFSKFERVCEWLLGVRRLTKYVHGNGSLHRCRSAYRELWWTDSVHGPVLPTRMTVLKKNLIVVLFADVSELPAPSVCSQFFDCCSCDSLQILQIPLGPVRPLSVA